MAEETMTIGSEVYFVKRVEMRQAELKFYPENPRVYSALRGTSTAEPEQAEIEKCMIQMDHVKKLKLSIEANGGLIDPLIVKEGANIVLEGNSRLAAYRILNKTNPIKWGMVKCILLPSNISDTAIFKLLGQYHIVGRKDWSPFEQGGYLYRRMQTTKYPVAKMAEELGISAATAKNFVDVYTFMVENDDITPDKWSYYEEYLKNKSIREARENDKDLDTIVVEKIKSGEIERAQDIRKLGDIISIKTESSKENLAGIKAGAISITEAYNDLTVDKQISDINKQFERFKKLINGKDIVKTMQEADEESREKAKFELDKIQKRIVNILSKIDQ